MIFGDDNDVEVMDMDGPPQPRQQTMDSDVGGGSWPTAEAYEARSPISQTQSMRTLGSHADLQVQVRPVLWPCASWDSACAGTCALGTP